MQLKGNSSLDLDVLTALLEAPKCTLQRKEIKKQLESKYVPKLMSDGSFDVTISRTLTKLMSQGLLKKDDRGHKQVFYLVPEQERNALKEEMRKIRNVELITKLDVDEQQKILAENEADRAFLNAQWKWLCTRAKFEDIRQEEELKALFINQTFERNPELRNFKLVKLSDEELCTRAKFEDIRQEEEMDALFINQTFEKYPELRNLTLENLSFEEVQKLLKDLYQFRNCSRS